MTLTLPGFRRFILLLGITDVVFSLTTPVEGVLVGDGDDMDFFFASFGCSLRAGIRALFRLRFLISAGRPFMKMVFSFNLFWSRPS